MAQGRPSTIPILPIFCLFLSLVGGIIATWSLARLSLGRGGWGAAMPREKNPPSDRASEIRAELIRTISAFVGSAESRPTGIPGLALYRHTSPTASSPVTFEPSVAVVVQGRERVELRQNAFTYDPSRFLLTSLGLPVVSRVIEASETTPYLCMVLQLEIPVVRELLNREEVQPSEAPPDSLAMATGDISTELLDAFRRLIYLLDTPKDIPFFEGMISREIVYRILHGPAGARLRAIATLGDQSNRTAKAIALIRANYAKPLRVDELAAAAGMGVSTFHRHFQALTAMSPVQYQKQLRLQAARRRMLDGRDVTAAAFEVGYGSASQFTREYSRFFGQPPTRDIQSFRASEHSPIGTGT